MACYGKAHVKVGRRLKENEKKIAKREYQLRKGDSVIVLCKKCKWLSFDHKVCMFCHVQFPATTEVKVIKRNKQIIKLTSGNIKSKGSAKLKVEVLDQPKEDKTEQRSVLRHEQQKAQSNTNKDSFQSLVKSVEKHDLDSLNEKGWLNDTIIDVYLQYIYHKQFRQDIRERSHIFSTHFFSALEKNWLKEDEKTKNDVERQKDWVSSNTWTKKVDLLSKDFLFIPIHYKKYKHWYLIVLCYLTESIKGHETYKKKQSSEPPNTESIEKTPCLYVFDSCDNSVDGLAEQKINCIRYIKEFLQTLLSIKNPDVKYDWTEILYKKTNCPQQNNNYDCGIFVLHYVEKFFKISISPSLDFSKWFSTEELRNKRTEVKNTIKELQESVSCMS